MYHVIIECYLYLQDTKYLLERERVYNGVLIQVSLFHY